MYKFLISLIIALSINISVFSMDVISNHMKINLPQSIVNNITVVNGDSISVLTPNHLLVYANHSLSSQSANKYLYFSTIPIFEPKSGEYFLNTWKANLMKENPNIIFSQINSDKNGILSILKPSQGRYYIWCTFIQNNHCYSISCSGNSDFDSTKELGMKLFNTVSYW